MSQIGSGGGSSGSIADQALGLLIMLSDPQTHKDRLKEFAEAEASARQAQDEVAAKVKEYQDTVTVTEAKAKDLMAKEADLEKQIADLKEKQAAVNAMFTEYTQKLKQLKAIAS